MGERYIRFDDEIGRDDEAVMPLYDANGFIAGLQVAVRKPDSWISFNSKGIIYKHLLVSTTADQIHCFDEMV